MRRATGARHRIAIDGEILARDARPRVLARALEPRGGDALALGRIAQQREQRIGIARVVGEDAEPSAGEQLDRAGIRRGDDRRAARHRLEVRDAESLVRARQREHPRLAIGLRERGIVGEVREAHLRMRRRLAVGDEVELGVGISRRDALDEQVVQPPPALASVPEPDVQHARLLALRAGPEHGVVHAAADDALDAVHLGLVAAERDGDGREPVREALGAVEQILQRAARQARGVLRFAERGAVQRAHRGARTAEREPVVAVEVDDVRVAARRAR